MKGNTIDAHDQGRDSRSWLTVPLASTLVAIALLAAACSGGSATPGVANIGSTTTTTGAETASQDTASPADYADDVSYAQCMRTHGIPRLPDPNAQGDFQFSPGTGVNPNSSQFSSANKDCEHLEPNGGRQTPAENEEALAVALKIVACMRTHGEPNFPDPVMSNGVLKGFILRGDGVDPRSPQFQAAQKACQSLFDQFGAIP